MRNSLAISSLAVILIACGGGGDPLAEYAETLEALVFEMSVEFEAGDLQVTGSPTIETAREVITGAFDIRYEFQADLIALDAPDEVADLHADLVEQHARIVSAHEAFAARAETATALEDLDQSAEAQAYRAVQSEAVSTCQELQAKIDATADQGGFGIGTGAWVAGNLREAVEVTFGC